jgi:hypothetical protein
VIRLRQGYGGQVREAGTRQFLVLKGVAVSGLKELIALVESRRDVGRLAGGATTGLSGKQTFQAPAGAP